MPLAIRYDDKVHDLAFSGDIVVLCDHCGREIDHEHPGNLEHEHRDHAPVYFLHKECSIAFRIGKPTMLWNQIESISNLKGTILHFELGASKRCAPGKRPRKNAKRGLEFRDVNGSRILHTRS